MTTTPSRPHRRRRLASDEAHAWARSLRLGNPYAKSVLMSLTLYVNEEAACFVSIGQLAEDTDLSDDTVRKRLKFLEDVGAIVRFPRWRDESGRANSEGRGKRTTDDIRLLVDADPDAIEARARGEGSPENGHETTEISPGPQQGLNSPDETVSPRPALGQPSQSCEGLISEPEPELSPKPPSGGVCDPIPDQGKAREPEHFDVFFTGCLGWRTMPRDLALIAFSALTPDEQAWARVASPLHAAECTKFKRRSKDAHRLIRESFWERYPSAKLSETAAEQVWIAAGSDQDRALRFVRGLTRVPLPFVLTRADGSKGYRHKAEVGADLLAMLLFADQSPMGWQKVDRGASHFAAWQSRFADWVGAALPVDPATAQIRVPTLWPPKKDGTIYRDDEPPASQEPDHG